MEQDCLAVATEPIVCQRKGSPDALDQLPNEPQTGGEMVAAEGHHPPPQCKDAPRAEPEEDINVSEETLREDSPILSDDMADAAKAEDEGAVAVFQGSPTEAEEMEIEMELELPEEQLQQLQTDGEICEESKNLVEGSVSLSLWLGALPTGEDAEVYSSLEGEVAECMSEIEVISDPTEDSAFSDSQNSRLVVPVDGGVESLDEDTTEKSAETEEESRQLDPQLYGLDDSESGQKFSALAETNPTAVSQEPENVEPHDVFVSNSPPFLREEEEGEEADEASEDFKHLDISSAQQKLMRSDSNLKPAQTPYSEDSITSEVNPASTRPAVPMGQQQVVQLPQGHSENAPRGQNQEAAQQVLSQGSPPLSAVAMEPANQGAGGSQGFGCVEPVTEENSRVGDKGEAETWQTGGEKGQKESGLGTAEAVRQKRSQGEVYECSQMEAKQGRKIESYSSVFATEHSCGSRMESDLYDDSQSDSGVSADFSPGSTFEIHTTAMTNTELSKPQANETPIEKEIRRAIEREQSLRRSRGLQNPPPTPEYVQIPLRKPVLSQGPRVRSEINQGKDRQLAGKMMQNEVQVEAQREQALVKIGTVPGVYDKGTVRQLKERKQLFQVFQESRDSGCNVSPGNKAPSWATASDISTLEKNQGVVTSQASTPGGSFVERRPSVDQLNPGQSSTSPSTRGGGFSYSSPRGPGLSEGTGCQVIILESNLSAQSLCPSKPQHHSHRSGSLTETRAFNVVDSGTHSTSSAGRGEHWDTTRREEEEKREDDEEEELVPRENPFFKLRSCSTSVIKVEQDIREAQEREKELRRQRNSLYGGGVAVREGGGGEGRGAQVVGGREREASLDGPTSPFPPPVNPLAIPDKPVSPVGRRAGPPAVPQCLGKLGVWPPEEKQVIQPEFPASPRSPRQKTPLVRRWESGQVNGHGEEEQEDDND